MDTTRIKRMMRLSAIAFFLSASNCVLLSGRHDIRAIDALSFTALGIGLGALICSAAIYFRARRREDINPVL